MAFRIAKTNKEKAEEEEKNRKEDEARKRVLADFLDEHGDDGDDAPGDDVPASDDFQAGLVPSNTRRHFAVKPRTGKSGPGTLDSAYGAQPRFGGPPNPRSGGMPPHGLHGSDRPNENVYKRVVAQASNLPPHMDDRGVEELFAAYPSLKIVNIDTLPPAGPVNRGRPSLTMKITFAEDAEPRELDDAMNKMSDKKYLGRGYYLHLDRYLGTHTKVQEQTMSFGGKMVAIEPSKDFAPPPEQGREGRRPDQRGGLRDFRDRRDRRDQRDYRDQREPRERLVVTAYPPPDLDTLKLINITIENVIKGGTEFEAALMQDPMVQEQERFAWLYDQKHPLNRYYRFRLYQLVTGDKRSSVEIFRGMGEWEGLSEPFPDEFVGNIEQLDADFDDRDEEGELAKYPEKTADPYPGMNDSGTGILTTRSRATLIWMLSRLAPGAPYNYEIAPFSAFAIEHAGHGLDEVVTILVTNIFTPICLSEASANYRAPNSGEGVDSRYRKNMKEATLNALRIISDVSLSAHKAGGKSYKYREAFETEIRDRGVFAYLEGLPKKMDWGRLDVNEFRQFVNDLLEHWKHEYLFSPEALDQFEKAFNWRVEEEKAKKEQEKKLAMAEKRKLEKLEAERKGTEKVTAPQPRAGPGMGSMDGANDVDAADSGADHTIHTTTSGDTNHEVQDVKMEEAPVPSLAEPEHRGNLDDQATGEPPGARSRRKRPKAEDMFASDEE